LRSGLRKGLLPIGIEEVLKDFHQKVAGGEPTVVGDRSELICHLGREMVSCELARGEGLLAAHWGSCCLILP
tara:strand:- start:146 stop:361 length:216 start_codon:yes stop_codon:yes gene_type:complete